MIIGCFALVEPFCGMARQFQAIREMGIQYADPAQPVAVYLLAGMLYNDKHGWCKAVKKAIVKRALEEPSFMSAIESNGLKLTGRAGDWSVKDKAALLTKLRETGWSDADILECCTVNPTQLAERAADQNSMVDAAEFLSSLPGVEQGEMLQYFRRVGKKDTVEQVKELMS